MTNSLQAKDDQWRDRRENASVPVFDPGMSPLGTDEEAGGARPVATPAEDGRPRAPMPPTPRTSNGGGLRLPPRFWYTVAAILIVVLVIVGWLSVAGSGSR